MVATAAWKPEYPAGGWKCGEEWHADRLGLPEHARLLQQTLDEESEADERLTEVAEDIVNPKAERR